MNGTPVSWTTVNTIGQYQKRDILVKATFYEKALFTSKLVSNLKKNVAMWYIWSTAPYGAETWTLRKKIRNTRKVLQCGAEEECRSVGPTVTEMKYYIESRKKKDHPTCNKKGHLDCLHLA